MFFFNFKKLYVITRYVCDYETKNSRNHKTLFVVCNNVTNYVCDNATNYVCDFKICSGTLLT